MFRELAVRSVVVPIRQKPAVLAVPLCGPLTIKLLRANWEVLCDGSLEHPVPPYGC